MISNNINWKGATEMKKENLNQKQLEVLDWAMNAKNMNPFDVVKGIVNAEYTGIYELCTSLLTCREITQVVAVYLDEVSERVWEE